MEDCILHGDFGTINGWMKEYVWKYADRLNSKAWIQKITGREFTADDFLDYIEQKYGELYGI